MHLFPPLRNNAVRCLSVSPAGIKPLLTGDCQITTPSRTDHADAGDGVSTVGAAAAFGDAVAFEAVAGPFDEQGVARGAAGIAFAAEVADVDIIEAGSAADIDRLMDGGDGCRRQLLEFVLGVEAADMPGGVGAQFADDKIGEFAQLLGVVVDAGDDQGGHLQPDTVVVYSLKTVEDRLQAGSGIVAVGGIAKSLEVDIGGIEQGMGPLQHVLRHVAVTDKNIGDTGIAGAGGDIMTVLEKNGGLGIGVGDGAAFSFCRRRDNLLRRKGITDRELQTRRNLGDTGVLTPVAVHVAPRCGNREGTAAGVEMKEGFFLDGVDIAGDGVSVHQGVENPATILAYSAAPPFTVADNTEMGAQSAGDPVIVLLVVQPGFFHCVTCSAARQKQKTWPESAVR